MVKCETCKEEIINPKFILKELTNVGYVTVEFDSVICFLKYVLKKFKRKINKMMKNGK